MVSVERECRKHEISGYLRDEISERAGKHSVKKIESKEFCDIKCRPCCIPLSERLVTCRLHRVTLQAINVCILRFKARFSAIGKRHSRLLIKLLPSFSLVFFAFQIN